MGELLKRTFNLLDKKMCLKTIDKELDKYAKMEMDLSRQQCFVDALLKDYEDRFGEDLKTMKYNDSVYTRNNLTKWFFIILNSILAGFGIYLIIQFIKL